MAHLMDFLAFWLPDEQREKARASSEFLQWSELKNKCEIMLERGYFAGNERRENLSGPEKLVLKQEDRLFQTIWQKY